MFLRRICFLSVAFLIIIGGFDVKAQEKTDEIIKKLFEEPVDSVRKYLNYKNGYPFIHYTQVELKGRKHLWQLLKAHGVYDDSVRLKVITELNRKELRFFRPGNIIVVPDTFLADMRAYSIFPVTYHGADSLPKLIVVSNKYQCYACYEFGKLIRFAAANTGKERTPSYPGRYALVWREKVHRSSLDSSWVMPYTWNFHKEAGSAFHQFDMPGRPVSHSCIRQLEDDARWLFTWGKGIRKDSTGKYLPLSGTPVIIIDIFDFSRKKGGPWLDLKSNKDVSLELPQNPMSVEEALIPIIQIPKMSRGGLRNRERYIHAEDTLRARGLIRPGVKLTESVDFNKLKRMKKKQREKLLRKDGQEIH